MAGNEWHLPALDIFFEVSQVPGKNCRFDSVISSSPAVSVAAEAICHIDVCWLFSDGCTVVTGDRVVSMSLIAFERCKAPELAGILADELMSIC